MLAVATADRRKTIFSNSLLILALTLSLLPQSIEGRDSTNVTIIEQDTFSLIQRLATSPPNLRGKRGIGMTMREAGQPGSWEENLPLVRFLKPYWHYAWSPKIPEAARIPRVEFVPMMWGCYGGLDGIRASISTNVMPDVVSGRTKRLLGFNEPDQLEQANLSVEKAIECWPALQETGLPLGAPVMANNSGDWLPQWRDQAAVKNFSVAYTTVHWFSPPVSRAFKAKMVEIYLANGRKPLLITEFAPADWEAASPADNRFSQAQVLRFMKNVLPWLESRSFVAGYSWFPFRTTSAAGACSALFDEVGNPTSLSRYYRSVTKGKPRGNRAIKV